MAAISPSKSEKGPWHQVYKWTPVTEADTCVAVKLERPFYAYGLQVSGTFGGATVTLHGSIDGTNYAALEDADGNAVALTAAGISGSGRDMVLYLKPVTASGSSSSVTVSVLVMFLP